MADDKKKASIVIKKVQGGHAAAHGGAWKVAYADFVTAMMCFFLVMWLMGSDEETKASISDYFNNPRSPWRSDVSNKDMAPLGDMTGAGADVLKGQRGQVPEDMIQKPSRITMTKSGKEDAEALDDVMAYDGLINLDVLRFSVEEAQLFKPGSVTELTVRGKKILMKLGDFTQKYQGKLKIKTTYDAATAESTGGNYDQLVSRTVAVGNYMVAQRLIDQEKVSTGVDRKTRSPASERDLEVEHPPRKIEFFFDRMN